MPPRPVRGAGRSSPALYAWTTVQRSSDRMTLPDRPSTVRSVSVIGASPASSSAFRALARFRYSPAILFVTVASFARAAQSGHSTGYADQPRATAWAVASWEVRNRGLSSLLVAVAG